MDESLTFVPGETTIQIPITITEDNIDEESELFIATLSPESVASNDDLTVSPNLADVVIVDVARKSSSISGCYFVRGGYLAGS